MIQSFQTILFSLSSLLLSLSLRPSLSFSLFLWELFGFFKVAAGCVSGVGCVLRVTDQKDLGLTEDLFGYLAKKKKKRKEKMLRLVSTKLLPSSASMAAFTQGGHLTATTVTTSARFLSRAPLAAQQSALLRPSIASEYRHLLDTKPMIFCRYYSSESDDDSKKKNGPDGGATNPPEEDDDAEGKDSSASKGRKSAKGKGKKPTGNDNGASAAGAASAAGGEDDGAKKPDEILSPENEQNERSGNGSRALVQPQVPEHYPQVLAIPIAKRPIFPHGIHQIHLTDPKVFFPCSPPCSVQVLIPACLKCAGDQLAEGFE